MTDFWNFSNSWYVVEQHIVWIVVSLVLGIVVGWLTSGPRGGQTTGK